MLNLEQVVAIEEIKQLKGLYFRAVDTRDWDALRTVFADDVVCDYTGASIDPGTGFNAAPEATSEVLRGKDAAMDAIIGICSRVSTVHHGHTPEITITGHDSATGIWAMFDTLRFPEGSELYELTGYGHYTETYERVEGAWKIKTLRLSRLRMDVKYAAAER